MPMVTCLPRSVLVAVDFGLASARAVAVGGALAERCHSGVLRLLHAESMEAPAYFTSGQIERLERQRHERQAQAERYLAQFGRQHTSAPFSVVVHQRVPVDAILHESLSSDLVVMGTQGRRGPARWWLGSVAERVLREIARPLLIVRADAQPTVPSLFERAQVQAAGSDVAEGALRFARDLASCCGGNLLDTRAGPIEPEIARTTATMVIAPFPEHRAGAWLSSFGEPLVRSCPVPILFVPEDGHEPPPPTAESARRDGGKKTTTRPTKGR
jgi:nucleotide-binding universal stress UspA family protein